MGRHRAYEGCSLSYSSITSPWWPSFSSAFKLFAFTSFLSVGFMLCITHWRVRGVSCQPMSESVTYAHLHCIKQSCLANSLVPASRLA